MLVYKDNPVGIELFYYVKTFFCPYKLAYWPREWIRSIAFWRYPDRRRHLCYNSLTSVWEAAHRLMRTSLKHWSFHNQYALTFPDPLTSQILQRCPLTDFWREKVLFLDVMWPQSNQWESMLFGKKLNYITLSFTRNKSISILISLLEHSVIPWLVTTCYHPRNFLRGLQSIQQVWLVRLNSLANNEQLTR